MKVKHLIKKLQAFEDKEMDVKITNGEYGDYDDIHNLSIETVIYLGDNCYDFKDFPTYKPVKIAVIN
jgi:hypothetical protein